MHAVGRRRIWRFRVLARTVSPALAASLVASSLLTSGCAGRPHLKYSEVSRRAWEVRPRSVAILPLASAVAGEEATRTTACLLHRELMDANRFERVVPVDHVVAALGSRPELVEAVTRLRTTWMSAEAVDREAARTLCAALGVESLLFGEVTAWEERTHTHAHDGKVETVTEHSTGLAFRWLEGSGGEVLWRASHSRSSSEAEDPSDFLGCLIAIVVIPVVVVAAGARAVINLFRKHPPEPPRPPELRCDLETGTAREMSSLVRRMTEAWPAVTAGREGAVTGGN